MKIKLLLLLTFLALGTTTIFAQSTYYVDNMNGADSNNGLSENSAWKTLDKVKSTSWKYKPGDSILFHSGQVWQGRLFFNQLFGTKAAPIVFSSYGNGAKPHIKGNGEGSSTVQLMNCGYVTFNGFEVTNKGEQPKGGRYGIEIRANNYGEIYGTQIVNCDIHDVNGEQEKGKGQGGGILVKNTGNSVRSRLVDVLIEGNHIYDIVRNGIYGNYNFGLENPFRNKNIVIRKNVIERIPGDAIVAFGMENALVEYNICRNFTPLLDADDNAAAGIWAFNSSNTIIQYNQVSGHKAKHDGQGYDADFNCENTVIQYNYSFDNVGGFLLICSDGSKSTAFNTNPIVRYNLSIGDGFRTDGKKYANKAPSIHIAGPVEGAQIYNNTIYTPKKPSSVAKEFVKSNSWFGVSNNTSFYNNTFYGVDEMQFDMTTSKNNVFSNNAYHGTTNSLDDNPIAGTLLGNHYDSLTNKNTNGFNVDNNGGKDFFGNTASNNNVGFFSSNDQSILSLSKRLVANTLEVAIDGAISNANVRVVNLVDSLMEKHNAVTGVLPIDVSTYPQGVYMVILEDGSSVTTQKFIKVKDVEFDELEPTPNPIPKPPVETLEDEITLNVGEVKPLVIKNTLSWESDNEVVVSVDDNGIITALEGGVALISAFDDKGELIREITVVSISNGAVSVPQITNVISAETSAKILFTEGKNTTYHRVGYRAEGKPWQIADSVYNTALDSYQLSDLEANTTYHFRIRAMNNTNISAWSATVSFVTQLNEIDITLSEREVNLNTGDKHQLIATILPQEAANQELLWNSDNPSVVKVDNQGVVEALAGGIATITVTTLDGNVTTSATIISTSSGAVGIPVVLDISPSETSAEVAFTEGSNATYHRLEYRIRGSLWVEIDSVFNTSVDIYQLTGLLKGTTYQFRMRAVNGTGLSSWSKIQTFITSGSNARLNGNTSISNLEQDISIYPNPISSGMANIVLQKETSNLIIEIYTSIGQLYKVEKSTNTSRYKVDISGYSSGIYFLKIVTDNKMYTKRITIR
ncbi:Ig-like domain-containing protein [Flammeovirga kamogawensis]|uniref:Ig-like domain-containing protein n=1 Tax=Flammeovirga kamogawensis TaxID=373891 RepID=A0ABX8H180_9BACT|nr:Ig-like domain-containing protein [Flammeovirga kamogawensis]MBB6463269.1 hypothetical protein [Flammeovirga kamogawensis]QWG09581.1 Ig-like domain-containing protein [Flammeovirga kamogawensis]TRX65096.1 T9SS type A sorting domain-containing protein [Flammeovirga kamogawensis]